MPALLLHLAVYIAAILLYMVAMRLVLNHNPATRRAHRHVIAVIAGGWLLASLALMAVAPGGEAHDIFDYLFRGHMVAELGASPLADPPELFPDQPFYAYITWTDFVDAYGPLWEGASGAVAASTHALLVATGRWYDGAAQCPDSAASCFMLTSYVLAYRSLAVLLAGLCGWLIYALTARQSPPLARAALLVWLWNPLLLVSSAVGAHNDMVMLLFVLASFWSLQRRWWLAALLLLVLAAHVKLTALTLTPLYGLWLVRQLGWRHALGYAAVAALLGLAISWLLYAPFGGWATLPRMLEERQRYVALSPHHVLYRILYELGWDAALTRNLTIHWPTISTWSGRSSSPARWWAGAAPIRSTCAPATCASSGVRRRSSTSSICWSAATGSNPGTCCGCWRRPRCCRRAASPATCCPGSAPARSAATSSPTTSRNCPARPLRAPVA